MKPNKLPKSSSLQGLTLSPSHDPEARLDFGRKRSLIRPERQRIARDHPNYHYRTHAQHMAILPSTTGNDASDFVANSEMGDSSGSGTKFVELETRGSVKSKNIDSQVTQLSFWTVYCRFVTMCIPSSVMKCFGIVGKNQQRAWREKVGLISLILLVCAFVGFLTFGFTAAVCPAATTRFRANQISEGYLIINGRTYDLTNSRHPAALGIPAGSNVLYPPVSAGGKDASFLFQNVNSHCKSLVQPTSSSNITSDKNGNMGWYFPCTVFAQDGSTAPNSTFNEYNGYACHTTANGRNAYYQMQVAGEVFFTWDDLKNSSRNLVVYSGSVIDLDLLSWLDPSQISFPGDWIEIQNGTLNDSLRGRDVTHIFAQTGRKKTGACFADLLRVGSVDSDTIGCIASKVVLYVSLVFIVSIVTIKFLLAVFFGWFISPRIVSYKSEDYKDSERRAKEIEEWSNNINKPAPLRHGRGIMPRSKFASGSNERGIGGAYQQQRRSRLIPPGAESKKSLLGEHSNYSSSSLMLGTENRTSQLLLDDGPGPAGFSHEGVVPQPPPEWQPFGFPLLYTICLVTAYSESLQGVRTTLDSIATTDYPNSHKLILVICDGLIKGHGNDMTTSEIVLSMMKDFDVPQEQVIPHSYVAIANGYKRHNMAKVYSGYYDYDDLSISPEKQQRVPMICIVKCGTDQEKLDPKPGNRGKRDSQIILMGFLQKVVFDERMTELEFEMFNGIWKVTGIPPDRYETVLMVDADTKVFPDSLTHMISCFVRDPQIMGLCGETKIANKSASWVSMIQVFEYFISHHLSKAFESIFGGVTCLPGCFCMYRIKTPKGQMGYWVPILANPDIIEHYSENVVDTLHMKNLLLLGEDRYLSTLMLKTFPKRKMIFVPQAVCKTTVPEEFRVLLSQRRRWINSTIHNLMELILVRDLCGTFCFSMQFVVFIELIGTLVLPAAIAFTFYVISIAIVRKPVPIIPLVLLALILGLPAVLIVITAKKWIYVAWMLIYILSLPIWNLVLPLYAYWHFDDFGWGDTRKIDGETKASKGHGDKEGEFDSSHIIMKRWRDFERDRRRKTFIFPAIPLGDRSEDRHSSLGGYSTPRQSRPLT
ncbi:Chitin synthase 4 [Neolecta irregularis DAH-3]|uniref:chitin synthase n=1 Tax=Neolecta irregularis (strain DAH-3) TaxID=1198029 RepID=A0A1U7LMK5_NEOID|nr:Chitin synthase 4 [Neolecta irregularis DAH-3]|eukprot:OLL23858.1 Chitin synthase 4 [Neolecta irregularis DAH-3]